MDSRKTKARKTNTLVQIPALWVWELTPNASKRERTTRTIVPPLSAYSHDKDSRTYIRAKERMEGGRKPLHQVILEIHGSSLRYSRSD